MAIEAHKKRGASFTLGHNMWSDLTDEEFFRTRLGLNSRASNLIHQYAHRLVPPMDMDLKIPASKDWVAEGAVTAVKNQDYCGGCWAFSAAGAMEGAYQIAGHELTNLSVQDLISCDYYSKWTPYFMENESSSGCMGGQMSYAFDYIQAHGITAEGNNPFKSQMGQQPPCPYANIQLNKNQTAVASVNWHAPKPGLKTNVTIDGFVAVFSNDQKALKRAVARQPVSVAIQANHSVFHNYKSGIISGADEFRQCGTSLDHGVLVVGYGVDNGIEYWKVKNSWGPDWGEEGYVRLAMGYEQKGGFCGILKQPTYPFNLTNNPS